MSQSPAQTVEDLTPPQASASASVICEHLERVLASRTFRSAEGQRSFLRYAVEQTIAGRGSLIKEYSVGIEVFHRGENFDPRMDNIVRAEARKLRVRLAKYYAAEGAADRIRFEFPKGSYAPSILAGPPDVAAEPAVTLDAPVSPEADLVPQPDLVPHPEEHVSAVELPARRPRWLNWGVAAAAVAAVLAGLLFWNLRMRGTAAQANISSPSVAVLPFTNLGDNRKDDSFSDGLTEELIDSLVRVPGLHVVARTSAFQFKGKTSDAQDIGRKLHVRTVLEGTVRQYGDHLRVTAELDETSTGYTVWSKSFDRQLKDVLGIQREISSAIVNSLGSSLTGNGTILPADLSSRPANIDPDAYQSWLKGLYFLNKRTAASVLTAVGYFEESAKKDPSYAPAWLGIARSYSMLPVFTAAVSTREAIPRIRTAAAKVLELDPSQGGAHQALAAAFADEMDWSGAEAEIKKALALDPGDASAHRLYANYLTKRGRLQEALTESRNALDLDPLSLTAQTSVARDLYDLRQTRDAIATYNQALSLDPEAGGASQGLALALLAAGKYSEGVAEADKARRLMGGDAMITSDLGYAYALAGKTREARQILDELLHWSGKEPLRALPIAHVYLGLGDKDHALEWLGKAIDQQDVNIYLKSDPRYDPLRTDPRFSQLLKRMNL
jgi:TolB-like protein/tetratricopeptide (TPR) repeat protein